MPRRPDLAQLPSILEGKFEHPFTRALRSGVESLATLPSRALRAAGELQRTGEYDPGPALEAAGLVLGGTAFGAPRGAIGAGPAFKYDPAKGASYGSPTGPMIKNHAGLAKDIPGYQPPSPYSGGHLPSNYDAIYEASYNWGLKQGVSPGAAAQFADKKAMAGDTSLLKYAPKKETPKYTLFGEEVSEGIFKRAEKMAIDAIDGKIPMVGPDAPDIIKKAAKTYAPLAQSTKPGTEAAIKATLPKTIGEMYSQSPFVAKPKSATDWDWAEMPVVDPYDLPREIPFGVPPKAQALGFTTPAVHGTTRRPGGSWSAERLEQDFGSFALPENEIGVHFGSPRAAQEFTGNRWPSAAPRKFPVVLRTENPLEMKDLGSWTPYKITAELERLGFPEKEIREALYKSGPKSEIEKLRDYISSKGYDSIRYKNAVEDPGHISTILMDPARARVPWAKFDPAKLSDPNLLSGLAGLGALPLVLPKDYRRGRDAP